MPDFSFALQADQLADRFFDWYTRIGRVKLVKKEGIRAEVREAPLAGCAQEFGAGIYLSSPGTANPAFGGNRNATISELFPERDPEQLFVMTDFALSSAVGIRRVEE